MIQISTIIVAFTSMIYELLLSQTMTAFFGGTVTQYTLTIGIYTTSMGIGALSYGLFKENKVQNFINFELLLAIFGAFTPILLILLKNHVSENILHGIGFFCIFFVGFLSGLELPFLMDLEENTHNQFSAKILFIDYGGCFLGLVIYSAILINIFDTFMIAFILGFLNAFSALIVAKKYKKSYYLILFIMGIFLMGMIFNSAILELMQKLFVA